ncbi:MAG: thiamine pyrophosphate-dependent enzyme [Planctomycetota bacterium]
MSIRREQHVKARLEALLDELATLEVKPGGAGDQPIPKEAALICVEAGFKSRLVDLKARELKNRGLGYYTVGSAGHESNAILGHLLRTTDPSLLHYRSGAFMAARMQKEPGSSFLSDTLLSLVASREDPVCQSRHKVWGSRTLWVPPQTSTIASHLPKAVGMAYAIERARRLGLPLEIPDDSIVACSFGDASINHASATTAFNAASWSKHQNLPLPLLFVCEDNELGISVHTPREWIEDNFRQRSGFVYFSADGGDLSGAYETVSRAITYCRQSRRPCFLHLRVVRLLGHAGSDVETGYREESSIEATEKRDPLIAMARFVVEQGFTAGSELRRLYEDLRARVDRIAERAVRRPVHESVAELRSPLAWPEWEDIRAEASEQQSEDARLPLFDGCLPENGKKRHMAMLISWALTDLMGRYPEMIVFGEDVAKKGGVYHLTAGLYDRFGVGRVFNTLLDETMILGTAIGAAQIGYLPVPEIQYLAYLHNAIDQLRGEACSQRFFSDCQWDNPMVVRIASLAYQEGFGGHFHNDNGIGALREIPGLILAVPSRGDDAVGMLRTSVAAARVGRSVVAFLEPIALYMKKDLHEKGDEAWSFHYPPPGEAVPIGSPRQYPIEASRRKRPKLLCVTFGNGVPMALRARRSLGAEDRVQVMDLRWLAPLPLEDLCEQARRARTVLVLDECRRSGGIAEAVIAALAEDPRTRRKTVQRITARDSYVPLGSAAELVLPAEEDVKAAFAEQLGGATKVPATKVPATKVPATKVPGTVDSFTPDS